MFRAGLLSPESTTKLQRTCHGLRQLVSSPPPPARRKPDQPGCPVYYNGSFTARQAAAKGWLMSNPTMRDPDGLPAAPAGSAAYGGQARGGSDAYAAYYAG